MCLLDILQVSNEIPESALGCHGVWSENFHLEEWWIWFLVCWESSANHSVLFKLKERETEKG